MPKRTRPHGILLFTAAAAFLVAVNAALYWALAAAKIHWHDPGIPFSYKAPILVMVSVFLGATAITDLLLLLNWRTISQGGRAFLAIVAVCSLILFALAITSPARGSADNFWNVLMSRGWTMEGKDPYISTPNDLRSDPVFPMIARSWRSSSMVYGPVWTLLAALPVIAFHNIGAQLIGMKMLTSVGYAAAGVLLYLRYKKRDKAAANMLLAAWMLNPVAIFEVANGAHNEGILVLAIAVFAVGLMERRPDWALPGLTAAVLIKIWPVILLPALLGVRGASKKSWFTGAAVSAAIAAGSFAVFSNMAEVLPSLLVVYQKGIIAKFSPGYYALWRFFGRPLTFSGQHRITVWATAIFCIVAATTSIMLVARRLRPIAASRTIIFAFLLLALGWLQPWYLIAAAPFLVLSDDSEKAPDILIYFAVSAFAVANYAFGWGILAGMCLFLGTIAVVVFRPFVLDAQKIPNK